MMNRSARAAALWAAAFFALLAFPLPAEPPESRPLPDRVILTPVKTYPHDADSFCQGLFCGEGADAPFFYESAGLYGRSAIKRVSLEGKTLEKKKLSQQFFGEGAAALDGKIFQITWREETCFVYDAKTLRPLERFSYKGEGWGLTENGAELIMSDGSDRITFRSPADFSPIREIRVFQTSPKTGRRAPIPRLNELEWIDGEIWANIFETTLIARIDPNSGEVIQLLDFSRYVPEECKGSPEKVLNGIAWDRAGRRLFITGKEWPVLYELAIDNDPLKKRAE
ncbi:MAG: glutaminyl-peptide cyclotransferase [Thermoguttaceae bacterium]|nr:glutaminyl-peptide cyclotransferase [Thermoguttaceae bacterium]